MNGEMMQTWLPIGVSVLSLILAAIALGWNIYRDVVLKARVRVRFAIVRMTIPGSREQPKERYLRISATNHGPGPVTVHMISGMKGPLWRRMVRRSEPFIILNDHANRLNPNLPHRLELGDAINLYLPYDDRCVLSTDATHLGVSDSFGRVHLAPKKHLRDARKQFKEDFPHVETRVL